MRSNTKECRTIRGLDGNRTHDIAASTNTASNVPQRLIDISYHLGVNSNLNKPEKKPPNPDWVRWSILEARRHDIPILLKDNLERPEEIREFPK